MEIFNTSRIRFYELYKDALSFISQTYTNLSQQFTMASPMGQLLQVILGLGRMIKYIIKDKNGDFINIGDWMIYQLGTPYEAKCKLIEKDNELYFANWDDGTPDTLVRGMWSPASDEKITLKIKN